MKKLTIKQIKARLVSTKRAIDELRCWALDQAFVSGLTRVKIKKKKKKKNPILEAFIRKMFRPRSGTLKHDRRKDRWFIFDEKTGYYKPAKKPKGIK